MADTEKNGTNIKDTAQVTAATPESLFRILSLHRLFSVLSEAEREAVARAGTGDVRSFRQGEMIYSPRKYRKALGLVLSGNVVVTRKNDASVLLNSLSENGIFGAAALFADPVRIVADSQHSEADTGRSAADSQHSAAEPQTPAEYATEIRARTAASVWFIPGDTVKQLVRANPDFAESYIRFLSEKVRFLNRRIADFTAAGTERKVAGYLAGCPAETGSTICPNRSALARSLDIGRASLYRVLDSFEAKGLIRKTEKGIEILDKAGLQQLSLPG